MIVKAKKVKNNAAKASCSTVETDPSRSKKNVGQPKKVKQALPCSEKKRKRVMTQKGKKEQKASKDDNSFSMLSKQKRPDQTTRPEKNQKANEKARLIQNDHPDHPGFPDDNLGGDCSDLNHDESVNGTARKENDQYNAVFSQSAVPSIPTQKNPMAHLEVSQNQKELKNNPGCLNDAVGKQNTNGDPNCKKITGQEEKNDGVNDDNDDDSDNDDDYDYLNDDDEDEVDDDDDDDDEGDDDDDENGESNNEDDDEDDDDDEEEDGDEDDEEDEDEDDEEDEDENDEEEHDENDEEEDEEDEDEDQDEDEIDAGQDDEDHQEDKLKKGQQKRKLRYPFIRTTRQRLVTTKGKGRGKGPNKYVIHPSKRIKKE